MGSVAHLDVLPAPRGGGSIGAKAKLSLVDALLAEHEVRPCALLALRWLARHTGIERALCLAVDPESGRLAGLTGLGVPPAAVDAFSLDLADRAHPLVVSLSGGEPVAFHDSGQTVPRPFETPLGHSSFHAVPLGSSQHLQQELGPGLLLLTGAGDGPVTEDVLWAAELLGTRLAALGYLRNVTDLRRATEEIEENYRRLRLAEAATRAERDRLDLILNSVLEPILVTDPAGNIVRMNPPAERMFTFPGRRNSEVERRVQANDAVFTSFVSNLYAGQSLRWRGELNLLDPRTGATIPVEAISGRVVSKHGEETAVVTILHDLTE